MDNPFLESPYNDTEMLAAQESALVRRPEVGNLLYQALKRGETIHVLAERTGLRFYIVPEHYAGVWGYTVRYEDGSISPDHNRIILDNATVRDWCEHLKEIEE